MKLSFLILLTCWALALLIAPSLAQKRIKVAKKGYHPDLNTAEDSLQPPSKRHLQKATKKEQKKDVLPPYFETKRPESLEGWLSKPKADPPKAFVRKPGTNKDGFCRNTATYGIQCGARMDQCRKDSDCSGDSKCCLVANCGFLCVMPKAKPKSDTILKKKKKIKDLEAMESVTTAAGLKIEDITKIPEEAQPSKVVVPVE